MKLEINETNGVYTVSIEGWVDTAVAPEFNEQIQPVMQNADKEIVIDCSKLEYISSSGLRSFLTLRKECAAKGGHITITNINDQVSKVFKMTGFFNLFDIK